MLLWRFQFRKQLRQWIRRLWRFRRLGWKYE
jgi:hypothetical protein